jgi:WD40 repeat protein
MRQKPPTVCFQKSGPAIESVAFSPDGGRLVTVERSNEQPITIWDVHARTPERRIVTPGGFVHQAIFSPNGRLIAASCSGGTVIVWDAETGKLRFRLSAGSIDTGSVAFGPDGKRLVCGGWGTIKIWELQTGQEVLALKGHRHGVKSVAFSPDGRALASGGWDRTVRICQADTGLVDRTLFGDWLGGGTPCFHPQGRFLAWGGNDHLARIWDMQTGQAVAKLPHAHEVWSVAFSPEGDTLATCGRNEIKLWNWQEEVEKTVILQDADVWLGCLAFSPDGKRLASHRRRIGPKRESGNGDLVIWNAQTGQEVATIKQDPGPSTKVAFSPDGRYFAYAGEDGTVRLHELQTNTTHLVLKTQSGTIHGLAFSPDSRLIATTTSPPLTAKQPAVAKLSVFDVSTAKECLSMAADAALISNVEFTEKGKNLACSLRPGVIGIYDTVTGHEVQVVNGMRAAVSSLAITANGTRLAAAGEQGAIKILELTNGSLAAGDSDQHSERASHELAAKKAESSGNWVSAILELNWLLGSGSSEKTLYHRRGHAYRELGGHDKAIRDFSEALKRDPADDQARLERANAHLRLRHWDAAIADLTESIDGITVPDTRHARLYNDRGIAKLQVNRAGEAVADFSEALRLDPQNLAAFINRGNCHLRLEQWDKAIADLSRAVELDGKNASVRTSLGWAYFGKKDLSRAIAAYDEALQADPRWVWAFHNRAQAFAARGDWLKALSDFDQAIRLVPGNFGFYLNRGNVQAELGNWPKAAADFQMSAMLNPRDIGPPCLFALALLQHGDLQGYRTQGHSLLQRRGSVDAIGAAWIVWTCTLSPDRNPEAETILSLAETAVARDAKNYLVARSYGAALTRAGKRLQALSQLRDAAKLQEKCPSVWFYLAKVLADSGQEREAATWLARGEKWLAVIKAVGDRSIESSLSSWQQLPWYERVAVERLHAEAEIAILLAGLARTIP